MFAASSVQSGEIEREEEQLLYNLVLVSEWEVAEVWQS